MAEARVVYEAVFEGLLRHAVGARMTPALKAKLKELGVDLDQKLRGTYPVETWLACVDACAAALYPALPKEKALFELGTQMVDGYGATLLGKVQLKMGRMLGPRRVLERTPQSYRAGNNFTDVRLTAKGDRSYEMWVKEGGPSAPFITGSMVAMLKFAGARDPRVDVVHGTPPEAVFHISWS